MNAERVYDLYRGEATVWWMLVRETMPCFVEHSACVDIVVFSIVGDCNVSLLFIHVLQ